MLKFQFTLLGFACLLLNACVGEIPKTNLYDAGFELAIGEKPPCATWDAVHKRIEVWPNREGCDQLIIIHDN